MQSSSFWVLAVTTSETDKTFYPPLLIMIYASKWPYKLTSTPDAYWVYLWPSWGHFTSYCTPNNTPDHIKTRRSCSKQQQPSVWAAVVKSVINVVCVHFSTLEVPIWFSCLEVIWAKSCINVSAIDHKNLSHLKSTSMKRGIVLFPGVGGCLTSERRAFLSPRGERWEAEMHEYIESGGWCQRQGEKKREFSLGGLPVITELPHSYILISKSHVDSAGIKLFAWRRT